VLGHELDEFKLSYDSYSKKPFDTAKLKHIVGNLNDALSGYWPML